MKSCRVVFTAAGGMAPWGDLWPITVTDDTPREPDRLEATQLTLAGPRGVTGSERKHDRGVEVCAASPRTLFSCRPAASFCLRSIYFAAHVSSHKFRLMQSNGRHIVTTAS